MNQSATSGSFQKGYDPRRGRKKVEVYKGMTINELAQLHSNEAIHVLSCIMKCRDPENPDEPKPYKSASVLKSIEILLSYAHGKPVDQIKILETAAHTQGITALTTNQLLTIIKQDTKVTSDQ